MKKTTFGNTALMGLRNPLATEQNGDGSWEPAEQQFAEPIVGIATPYGEADAGVSACECTLLTQRDVTRVPTLSVSRIGRIWSSDNRKFALARIVAETSDLRTVKANTNAIAKAIKNLLNDAQGDDDTSVHPKPYMERWANSATTYYGIVAVDEAEPALIGILPNLVDEHIGDVRPLIARAGAIGDIQLMPSGLSYVEERTLVVALTTCIANNQDSGDGILNVLHLPGRPILRLPKGVTLVELSKIEFFGSTKRSLAMVTTTADDGETYTETPYDFTFVKDGGVAQEVRKIDGTSLRRTIETNEGVYVGAKAGQETFARISFEGKFVMVQDLQTSPLAAINALAFMGANVEIGG